MLKIGCHVSAAGGVFNAPKNAAALGCETFQIFSRPPQGGKAPELTDEIVGKFRQEMEAYGYDMFVIHCPYFINFGSKEPRIYHGSVSVVAQELKRGSTLGAAYVMTHLGTAKDLGQAKAFKQAKEGLVKVMEDYEGSKGQAGENKTQFLLEIAAGSGEVIGDTFEELAELMEPLKKFKTFGGICFDTQHAFASGYDLRNTEAVAETFKKFDKIIGLKYLKMSHANDSKVDLASRKDRHEHIGEGQIGKEGFGAILEFLSKLELGKTLSSPRQARGALPREGERNKVLRSIPLILETEHDKVKADIKILKTLRDKTASKK